jgi:hypothetical protein
MFILAQRFQSMVAWVCWFGACSVVTEHHGGSTQHMLFSFELIALLRYNSYTNLSSLVQWFLAYTQKCATITTIWVLHITAAMKQREKGRGWAPNRQLKCTSWWCNLPQLFPPPPSIATSWRPILQHMSLWGKFQIQIITVIMNLYFLTYMLLLCNRGFPKLFACIFIIALGTWIWGYIFTHLFL